MDPKKKRAIPEFSVDLGLWVLSSIIKFFLHCLFPVLHPLLFCSVVSYHGSYPSPIYITVTLLYGCHNSMIL